MIDQRGKVLSFGPFELSIGNRLLTNGAKVVPLGARAMDLLIVLTEQANKVVGRRTLIERVWPKRGAEPVSLRVHISALRKALEQSDPGRRHIANVPGQGYSFVVPVSFPFLASFGGSQSVFEAPSACALDADAWTKRRHGRDPDEAGRAEVRDDRRAWRHRQDHGSGRSCS